MRSAAAAPGAPPEWEGWDDSAVAPEKLGAYLRDIRKLLDEYQLPRRRSTAISVTAAFTCASASTSKAKRGIRNYGEFVDRAADLVLSYGGSLSGEHGDGQSRGALLPKMFGPELMQAFRDFKSAWDPDNRMNPHKVVDAYLPTENLRLGADYKPLRRPRTSNFPTTAVRWRRPACVAWGLGECRKQEGGAMCPSYRVTLEEEHSTRGRAHMLFELLQGEVVRDAWKDEHIKQRARSVPFLQGLQVGVSDERGHRHVSRRIPFPLLRRQGPAAARARIRAYRSLGAAGVACARAWRTFSIARPALAICCERAAPGAATSRFRSSQRDVSALGASAAHSRARARPAGGAAEATREVILWADTFNNYFHPETSRAALEVLRARGFRGERPARPSLLRTAPLRFRHDRYGQGLSRSASCPRSARRSRRACRWWCSSRVALPCFATNCAIFFPQMRGRPSAKPDVSPQ